MATRREDGTGPAETSGEPAGAQVAIGPTTAKVLRLLVADPGAPRDDWDIAQASGVAGHSVRHVTAALLRAGWLVSAHADPGDGRPARHCYTMTPEGASAARRGLAEIAARQSAQETGARRRLDEMAAPPPPRSSPPASRPAQARAVSDVTAMGPHTAEVLRLLIDDPYTPRDSWDVVRAIDVPVTRARQAMTSLERAGWLARSHLDPGDGRPARFCYTMTPAGIAAARRQLAEMAAEYELMDAARAAGDSWQLIGARLGRRTAQATRQRYLALARVLALTTEEGGRS